MLHLHLLRVSRWLSTCHFAHGSNFGCSFMCTRKGRVESLKFFGWLPKVRFVAPWKTKMEEAEGLWIFLLRKTCGEEDRYSPTIRKRRTWKRRISSGTMKTMTMIEWEDQGLVKCMRRHRVTKKTCNICRTERILMSLTSG